MQTQPLKIIMDPRSPATPDELQQQLQLGQQIFADAIEARRALAEIGSVEKQLNDLEQKVGGENPALKAALTEAHSEIAKILTNKESAEKQPAENGAEGLQEAYTDLASALHVVEGGDRTVPSQAIALYKESSARVNKGIVQWTTFKQTKFPLLNQQLRERNLTPIAISGIE
jgi:hypothetical protein